MEKGRTMPEGDVSLSLVANFCALPPNECPSGAAAYAPRANRGGLLSSSIPGKASIACHPVGRARPVPGMPHRRQISQPRDMRRDDDATIGLFVEVMSALDG